MDPITVLTTISGVLNLVDRFTGLTRKFFGKESRPHSVTARQRSDVLEIEANGRIAERIHANSLQMSEWDERRYKTLERKVDRNWNIYNDIDEELPIASPEEKARLKQKLKGILSELCKDFREMMDINEKTLGIALGDHYSLDVACEGM